MPYKDKEKQREASKRAMAKKRGNVNPVNPDVIPIVNPVNVNPVIPCGKCGGLEGRILFLTEQLVLANQEITELKERTAISTYGKYPLYSSNNLVPVKETVFSLPVYNWQTAKVGERYRKFINGRWSEIVAVGLDANGFGVFDPEKPDTAVDAERNEV